MHLLDTKRMIDIVRLKRGALGVCIYMSRVFLHFFLLKMEPFGMNNYFQKA